MSAENRTRTPTRLNWRFLLGEFVVIVVGVLLALWVDQLRETRVNAGLEVEYLRSLVVDIDADLAHSWAWMRRSEATAATVIALYEGSPPTDNVADEVVYQTINGRAGLEDMRRSALELEATLEQRLEST